MNRTNDLQALSALAIDLPGGGFVRVRKATPAFQMWRGPKPADTFGGKAVLDYCGNPLFAEQYTLRMLQADGWSGVWVNSYRREYLASYEPREQVALPAIRQKALSRIAGNDAFPSGCWDVFAWRDDRILFAECKRASKDAMRPSQRRWLEKALAAGVALETFLIVEWTLLE
jgi:hypothetical protein